MQTWCWAKMLTLLVISSYGQGPFAKMFMKVNFSCMDKSSRERSAHGKEKKILHVDAKNTSKIWGVKTKGFDCEGKAMLAPCLQAATRHPDFNMRSKVNPSDVNVAIRWAIKGSCCSAIKGVNISQVKVSKMQPTFIHFVLETSLWG